MSESLTCLRCRQCRLEPDTDMTQPSPVIYCSIKKERSPLILSGCALADPRYYYRKSQDGSKRVIGGDKCHRPTPALKAWLRANYHRHPFAYLVRVTGRSREALTALARREDWGCHGRLAIERQQQGQKVSLSRQQQGRALTQAQRDYVLRRYGQGDWPARGGSNNAAHLARRYALQQEILDDLAGLGPRWQWPILTKFIARNSPSALRRKQQRTQKGLR